MFEEDLAGLLRWVDADAVVRDDRRGGLVLLELLADEAEHRGEGRLARHLHHLERQLRVRRQRDLEGDLWV